MAEVRKRVMLQLEKEDRISDLPDSIIQRILVLLPSTKDAIRTSVLSKRWHNQWRRVPVLIFDNSGLSDENFSRFVDNTLLLHDCSKIQKFHIQTVGYLVWADPHFNSKLRFAITKNVEELILDFKQSDSEFLLPDFLFYHDSLVKLQIYNCDVMCYGTVRWEQLRVLNMEYPSLSDVAIKNILIGSPLLEVLEIISWYEFSKPIISSKSLKKMVLEFDDFVEAFQIEISCPELEELKLVGCFGTTNIEFKDLSSLICATLDFDVVDDDGSLAAILQQLRHVKKLTFGSKFIRGLARLKDTDDLGFPLLINKSLTLDRPDFGEHPAGIEYALRIFPFLEKLVIKDLVYKNAGLSTKYWDSKGKTSNYIVSNIKTVHFVGVGKRSKCRVPHDFVDFLLMNSPVMEKLVMLRDI